MNIKRKKVIFGSVIGLTVLSLCSIGFSVWIIGIYQPQTSINGIPVNVDTISEETCYLNIVKSTDENGLILAESQANTVGDGIGYDNSTGQKSSDLTITLGQYDFAFASTSTFTSLTFDVTCNSRPLQGTVSSPDLFGRGAGTKKDYITLKSYSGVDSLSEDFTLDKTTISGYHIYKANSKTLTFTWGDFFGGESPATFYGDKIDDITDTTEKLKAMNQAKTELEAMKEFFKKSDSSFYTIDIKATLSIKFAQTN